MDSNTNEKNILDYENSIKELEKLENEKMNLYKDLGELNLSEENKSNIHNKIDIQNKKISEVTQKGIDAITKIDKAKDLTSEQKAKVEQIAKKNKPEIDVLEFMLSYPQISREFEDYHIEDVKELAKIVQSSGNPKMDWKEARKIMEAVIKKRELKEKEDAILEEEVNNANLIPEAELDIPKAELDVPKAELDVPKAELDVPKAELDVPKAELDVPKAELDIPKAELDDPKAELDFSKAELDDPKEVIKEPIQIKEPISTISDINSFAKTVKSNVSKDIQNLNTNTCSEILNASVIINSKYPYPSQFPNLTKIKSMEFEPKKVEEVKEVKKDEEVKKGGKKLKIKIKNQKIKKIKKK